MKMGPNMRGFLTNIRAEPGVWTAPDLARDFNVSPSSARRTLRTLESRGLVRKESGDPPSGGGRRAYRYYPTAEDRTPTR